MDLNPSNMEIVMLMLLTVGMLFLLYVLIRAIAYHDAPPLDGSFSSDWGRKK